MNMTQEINSRDTYEVNELASRLNICRQAVYRGLRDGSIPGIRLGKRFIIPRAAVDNWLRSAGEKARPAA